MSLISMNSARFEQMLVLLGKFAYQYPMTSIDSLIDSIIEKKSKIFPKDKHALKILDAIIFHGYKNDAEMEFVQWLNSSFRDLLSSSEFNNLAPFYKENDSIKIAFWKQGDFVSDKIVSLLLTQGTEVGWVNEKGENVALIFDLQ